MSAEDEELTRIFRQALAGASAEALEASVHLEGELRAMCAAAVASLPGLRSSIPELVRHFARHARDGHPAREHAVDLALTFACGRGDTAAQRQLDPILTANVARAVGRMDPSPAFADLVAQELRSRLLLGAAPKITDYAGRGPLAGWLRTAATRAALNLRRGRTERGHDALASELRATEGDPELELLRARYRSEFESAVRAAVRGLSARDRAVLRLNVREGLSSDRIAALYRVGRSTVKRWLIAAREQLATETKHELRMRLALTSAEFDSIAAEVRSRVDVSILRLLDELEEDAGAQAP